MPRPPQLAPTAAAIRGAVSSSLTDRVDPSQEIFPLHVGDTYLEPPPQCAASALTGAADLYRYTATAGTGALREQVAASVSSRTGQRLGAEDVYVTAGATAGLAATLQALVEPGDEVLLLAPYWPLIEGMTRACGARPVAAPIGDLEPSADPEALIERLDGLCSQRCVALYYSSPNNPTGRLFPAAWIEALALFARRRDLWLLADDVYDLYCYAGEHRSALGLAPERTVVAYSASKAYAMAGNRCGWLIAPQPAMGAIQKLGTHAFYSAPTFAQHALARALESADDWVAETREAYGRIGRRTAEILGVPPPDGGTFLFLDVAACLGEGGLPELLERCARSNLLLAPGPSFGPFPTSIRLCFTAAPPETIVRAAQRLAGLLGEAGSAAAEAAAATGGRAR